MQAYGYSRDRALVPRLYRGYVEELWADCIGSVSARFLAS